MTTTFKNREYKVVEEIAVTALLANEGLVRQLIIQGAKNATYLLQEYKDGIRRAISTSGRVQTEYPV